MGNKTSIKTICTKFKKNTDDISQFISVCSARQNGTHTSFIYNYAIIKLYKDFENMVFQTLVGIINNDSSALSAKTGYAFPKHLNKLVCEYIIVKNGYFDFKGRDGLIKVLKDYLQDTHYLLQIVSDRKYKDKLEQLIALRNFAAHSSKKSRDTVLKVTGMQQLGHSGAWLKVGNRFQAIVDNLRDIADEISKKAKF